MFWCNIVKNQHKFCIYNGRWANFRILNSNVVDDILRFYATPINGKTCLIFAQRKGELFPTTLNLVFKFKEFQHVKFEAIGGDVIVAGEAYAGNYTYIKMDHFPSNCPFGDEEDWKLTERQQTSIPKKTDETNLLQNKSKNEKELEDLKWKEFREEAEREYRQHKGN